MKTQFHCDKCNKNKTHESTMSTGYGTMQNGDKHCFECCAITDAEAMGRDGKTTLYLDMSGSNGQFNYMWHTWKITNWPGTLKFNVVRASKGVHNMAGVRYDVWFHGPRGMTWHGVQYGNNTQIVHCKRLKAS